MNGLKFVSFGNDCRSGFQIRRYFGKDRCLPTIFDRQVTPPEAIYAYLENDFRGMFEADDVVRVGDHLYNMRYGTKYAHEVDDAARRSFAAGKAEHERLCELTRNALLGDAPVLAVVHWGRAFKCPTELITKLHDYSPDHEVLVVRDLGSGTPGQASWRGDNSQWDKAFSPFGEPIHLTPWQVQHKRLKRHIKRLRGSGMWEGY